MPRRALIGGALALLLGACSAGGHGIPGADPAFPSPRPEPALGAGQVPVALLLPLSGDPALAEVGTSMANAAQLAMEFIVRNEDIGDNIRLTIKDTGATAGGAAQAASAALGEGAKLILGPLKAEQVTAAGSVVRAAGVPLIGFSNNSGAAGPGVYLLNVLPESEVRRSMAYAQAQGRQAFAGVFPNSDFGRVQEGAFQQAAADLGINARAVYRFGSEAEARTVVEQLAPLLQQGRIDALFIPDRGTAPSFGVLLEAAGVAPGGALLIGSADWDGDAAIAGTPALSGAIYPAVDDAGYRALLPEYQARFGRPPHALATIAYTAVILANTEPLALGSPPYDRAQLTLPGGFNGRDGVFRFLPDGRSDHALVIKQVTSGGATVVDGPRLSSVGHQALATGQ